MATRVDPARESAFWAGVEHASRFFMGDADVQRALIKLTALLDDAQIPYAIAGAMALNEYGYRRVTTDVAVLLAPEGLAAQGALPRPRLPREVPGQQRAARYRERRRHRRADRR